MNQIRISLGIVFLLFIIATTNAQNATTDFAVEFKVTGDNSAINQTDGDFLSYAYKGNKMSMVLMNKMVDLKMVYDGDSKTGLLLNSMQSGALNVASKLSEESLMSKNQGMKVELLPGTKKIKGFKCSKALVSLKDKTIDVWYTPKLKPAKFEFQGYFFSKLDGFPLLMVETSKDGVLTSTAVKITKEVSESTFEQIIPKGYKTILFEELNGSK